MLNRWKPRIVELRLKLGMARCADAERDLYYALEERRCQKSRLRVLSSFELSVPGRVATCMEEDTRLRALFPNSQPRFLACSTQRLVEDTVKQIVHINDRLYSSAVPITALTKMPQSSLIGEKRRGRSERVDR